jgi:hypothetical protein
LAALFSFMVLAGFFFSVFFESMPLLMSNSALWKVGRERQRRSGRRQKLRARRDRSLGVGAVEAKPVPLGVFKAVVAMMPIASRRCQMRSCGAR